MGRWLSPKERAEKKLAEVYHVPMWEGDYQGFLKQLSLFEAYSITSYAEGEKRLLWDLPGHGQASADCGKGFLLGCTRHDEHESGMSFVRVKRHNCARKECPICFETWASLQGERALLRFATYYFGYDFVDKTIEKVKRRCEGKNGHTYHKELTSELEDYVKTRRVKVKHVVLSPPQDVTCEGVRDYRLLKESAYRVAKKSGLYGGAMIFHPYRLKCSLCGSAIPDYEKACPECGGELFAWFWSPHFHCVGLGFIEHTAEGYETHGWVVKNLGVRESVFWTFQYLLSHAGVSFLHTTTWFGKFGYNQLGRVPSSEGFREVCPHCLKGLKPVRWIGGQDRPPPEYDEKSDLNDILVGPGVVV